MYHSHYIQAANPCLKEGESGKPHPLPPPTHTPYSLLHHHCTYTWHTECWLSHACINVFSLKLCVCITVVGWKLSTLTKLLPSLVSWTSTRYNLTRIIIIYIDHLSHTLSIKIIAWPCTIACMLVLLHVMLPFCCVGRLHRCTGCSAGWMAVWREHPHWEVSLH